MGCCASKPAPEAEPEFTRQSREQGAANVVRVEREAAAATTPRRPPSTTDREARQELAMSGKGGRLASTSSLPSTPGATSACSPGSPLNTTNYSSRVIVATSASSGASSSSASAASAPRPVPPHHRQWTSIVERDTRTTATAPMQQQQNQSHGDSASAVSLASALSSFHLPPVSAMKLQLQSPANDSGNNNSSSPQVQGRDAGQQVLAPHPQSSLRSQPSVATPPSACATGSHPYAFSAPVTPLKLRGSGGNANATASQHSRPPQPQHQAQAQAQSSTLLIRRGASFSLGPSLMSPAEDGPGAATATMKATTTGNNQTLIKHQRSESILSDDSPSLCSTAGVLSLDDFVGMSPVVFPSKRNRKSTKRQQSSPGQPTSPQGVAGSSEAVGSAEAAQGSTPSSSGRRLTPRVSFSTTTAILVNPLSPHSSQSSPSVPILTGNNHSTPTATGNPSSAFDHHNSTSAGGVAGGGSATCGKVALEKVRHALGKLEHEQQQQEQRHIQAGTAQYSQPKQTRPSLPSLPSHSLLLESEGDGEVENQQRTQQQHHHPQQQPSCCSLDEVAEQVGAAPTSLARHNVSVPTTSSLTTDLLSPCSDGTSLTSTFSQLDSAGSAVSPLSPLAKAQRARGFVLARTSMRMSMMHTDDNSSSNQKEHALGGSLNSSGGAEVHSRELSTNHDDAQFLDDSRFAEELGEDDDDEGEWGDGTVLDTHQPKGWTTATFAKSNSSNNLLRRPRGSGTVVEHAVASSFPASCPASAIHLRSPHLLQSPPNIHASPVLTLATTGAGSSLLSPNSHTIPSMMSPATSVDNASTAAMLTPPQPPATTGVLTGSLYTANAGTGEEHPSHDSQLCPPSQRRRGCHQQPPAPQQQRENFYGPQHRRRTGALPASPAAGGGRRHGGESGGALTVWVAPHDNDK